MTGTSNRIVFKDYLYIEESMNIDLGTVHRDEPLESFARMSLPDETHDSIRALYTDHMDKTNTRVIKFKNTEGRIEYHLHSYDVHPFSKSTNESKAGFQSALRLIHDDAKTELDNGNEIHLQTIEGSDREKAIKSIATRLASRSGAKIEDVGSKALSTAPFLSGSTYIISKHATP